MSGRAEEFHAFVGDRASPLHRTAYLLCGDWHLAQPKGVVLHTTDNYTWLPRSASVLKQMTTPIIPAGFKRLAQLP